jgi:pimeloyl-ACP methyl ester carboxylesterase
MALAALDGSPVKKLVLNDVGPLLAAAALTRIGAYLAERPSLPTIEAAEAYVRSVYAPFGPHSDAEWRLLTEYVVKTEPDGSLRLHYDPALSVAFTAQPFDDDIELWHLYDNIRCPTLVLRGEHSDLLTRETARQMSQRGPRAKVVEFAGVGHAPALMHSDQIDVVEKFLLAK